MRRFHITLDTDGKGYVMKHKNFVRFYENRHDFSIEIKKMKSNEDMLVKVYPNETDIFNEERKLRKLLGNKVDWAILENGQYIAVKKSRKETKCYYDLIDYGFEKLAV